MTFAEISQAIAQMLAAGRELQETQIKHAADFDALRSVLTEQAEQHHQWLRREQ
ncbi:MAG: hypothetical protein KME35_16155 [Aphanocapsa sp. GSE-SYN-MK-11-07L]|jgi:hypothetical protein|nr:hypothetical protein [Aphanocapsa sp. GSE-SYN-MK-11-07L]